MPHLTLKIPTAKTSNTVTQPPSKAQPDSQRKDSGQTDQASSGGASPENPSQPADNVSSFTSHTPPEREPSPTAPPYSPITPKAAAAQLATYQPRGSTSAPAAAIPTRAEIAAALPQPTTIARPAPVPIDESTNTDAIALRSAIALLQLQRERSRRDIVALERVREEAMRDPAGFVDELGRRGKKRRAGEARADVLGPTLGAEAGAVESGAAMEEVKTEAKDTQDEDEEIVDEEQEGRDSDDNDEQPSEDKFPVMPTPQNVFRCPPINWAKYHITGEPLDRLHEEQRQRPTPGEPEYNGGRAQPYVLAAPYSPLNDNVGGVEHPMQTRKGSKKST